MSFEASLAATTDSEFVPQPELPKDDVPEESQSILAAAEAVMPTTSSRTVSSRRRHRSSASVSTAVFEDTPPPSPTPRLARKTAHQEANASTGAKRKRSRASLKQDPDQEKEDPNGEKKPKAVESCCICMCEIEPDQCAKISGCNHKFHFDCIEQWSKRENSCPLCKSRFRSIERLDKKRRKKGQKNSKRVRQRDQQAEVPSGSALVEGLIASLAANRHGGTVGRLIFREGSFLSETRRFAGLPVFPLAAGFGSAPWIHRFGNDNDMEDNPLDRFIRDSLTRIGDNAVHASQVQTTVVARSYASNSNDASAGVHANNPLEIDDSDDSDAEDDIEVVRVIPRVSSSSR